MHVIHKRLPQYQIDSKQNSDSTFRPLPQIQVSEEKFTDHQYGFDPYWEDCIYDRDNLQYRHN